MVKLKITLDDHDAQRILDNAARVAQRVAAWPTWKRGSDPAKEVSDAARRR